MASKKISILLADVDGTLVDSQKRITAGAETAIQKLAAAGIKFAVTSGRAAAGHEDDRPTGENVDAARRL